MLLGLRHSLAGFALEEFSMTFHHRKPQTGSIDDYHKG